MSDKTGIAWTDHTFNPWWGCTKVSPGCDFCYAERDSKRYGFDVWGSSAERRFFGDKHWNQPLIWNRQAAETGRRARVFCASMADVFEDRRDLDAQRERLWDLIIRTPELDWQLLTKRPENMRGLAPWGNGVWPDNVWAMTTAEDQERYDKRVRHLLRVDARVRGISYEPALGPLRLRTEEYVLIHWVIVGGESHQDRTKARPFDIAWADAVLKECKNSGVPVFMKQLGSRPRQGGEYAIRVEGISGKGDDPTEWPAWLNVREFPR